ncbi:LOW QUALITY PROTEIN: autophagy-related protein 13b-like [Curcuma longa]|uniref:LOW QUALITY PROTEIN: autophagy-related protein 13b-like n=1 Tax=Curcuma longa TaxID=136217 RepID=UPI003D9E36CC
MASTPSQSSSESAIVEQVITEFFAKSLHIILESRSPYVSSRNHSVDHFISSPSSSSSLSSSRPRDKWFNLALQDCPAALENFDIWRQSNLEPLIVDIILIHRQSVPDVAPCLLRNLSWNHELALQPRSEKIVERWILRYESVKRCSSNLKPKNQISKKNNRASSHLDETKLYDQSIILLRSLYVFIRLLPAYKLFHKLNASGRINPLSLSHKISSFVEHFTRAEVANMDQFSFVPIATPCGRLSVSVSYLRALEEIVGSESSTALSTQFIMDYVGSATTVPLKRFTSLPSARVEATIVSFTRQQSWNNDHQNLCTSSSSSSPTQYDAYGMHHNSSRRSPVLRHGSKQSSHIDNVRSQLTVATQTQTCLHETMAQTKGKSPRSSNSLGDINLHKECEYCKDEVVNLPNHASSSTYKPYSRNSSASSCLGEFDDWEISCLFVDEEDQTEPSNRIQISNDKNQSGERPATGDLAPVQRPSNAAVGALIVMLKGARPLREDSPNSLKSLRCSEVPSGNPGVQPDKECTPHVEQPSCHAVSLTTTLLKPKTAKDALEELRRYKEVKESIIGQSPPKEIRG